MKKTEKEILADMKKMDYYEAVAFLEKLQSLKIIREKRDRRLRRLYRSFLTTAKNHKTTIDEILSVGLGD